MSLNSNVKVLTQILVTPLGLGIQESTPVVYIHLKYIVRGEDFQASRPTSVATTASTSTTATTTTRRKMQRTTTATIRPFLFKQ